MRLFVLLALVPSAVFAQEATAASAPQGSPVASLLPLILIFAVFYFLLIRPQIRRQKEMVAMQAALKKGDEIITNGGAYAKYVRDEGDAAAIIEIAPGVEIKILKTAVASLASAKAAAVIPANQAKKKPGAEKNDNVVPDKQSVANDN